MRPLVGKSASSSMYPFRATAVAALQPSEFLVSREVWNELTQVRDSEILRQRHWHCLSKPVSALLCEIFVEVDWTTGYISELLNK
jgi:hypothetical protein